MAGKKKAPLKETDLYPPLREVLESKGYRVRSEVHGCDITAVKGDDLIVIELKVSFSTSLLIQATSRQKLTDSVYIALPRPRKQPRNWRGILHLLRRLELGLILVEPKGPARGIEIVFHPVAFKRRKNKKHRCAILKEIDQRSTEMNQGGSVRRKIMTAYRENCIHIACCLEQYGPLSPKQLRAMNTSPKTQSIVYNNHYGWFERIGQGLYALSGKGRKDLDEEYAKLAKNYRKIVRSTPPPDTD
jgi:hypothetical protein